MRSLGTVRSGSITVIRSDSYLRRGPVAQLGERHTGSVEVRGSSPLRSTSCVPPHPGRPASAARRLTAIRRPTETAIFCLALTDRGLQRNDNQDAAFVRCADGDAVLAVADGMGGMPAGDRASALAIAACERPPEPGESPQDYLFARVAAADGAVREDADANPARAGMGTTLVLALVRDGVAWVTHVGDSRAYLWQAGQLRALTLDHSVAGELVRDGRLDATDALSDSRRHLLTRAVGGRSGEPDLDGQFPLDGASALLLVSDGVSGVVEDAHIAAAAGAHVGRALAQALVEQAHAAGAPDNIGIALLDERC